MAGKVSIPSGYGGLMRYFEDYRSKYMIKPGHVIFFTVLIIVVIIVLYSLNPLGF